MKIRAIAIPYKNETNMDCLHTSMFHGEACRNGVEYPHNDYYYSDRERKHPLEITREGSLIPDITKPAERLVVSQEVHDKLQGIPGVAFFPVEFAKLFRYAYKLGDYSFLDDPVYMSTPELSATLFMENFPDELRFHAKAGRFYELLTPYLPDLKERYPEAEERELIEDKVEGPICPRMMEDYPLLQMYKGVVMQDHIFRLLEPHMPEPYFVNEVVDI